MIEIARKYATNGFQLVVIIFLLIVNNRLDQIQARLDVLDARLYDLAVKK